MPAGNLLESGNLPGGFEIPIYRGPLKPRLLLGIPKDFAALLLASGMLGVLWRLWALLPLVGVLYLFALWGTRQDPKWFEKAWQTIKYKRYYKA